MQPETKKHLFDIRQACTRILNYTHDKAFEDYANDDMLRSAVERQFEIAGEAMRRLGQEDENTMSMISDARRVISFRNILAHGYDNVSNEIVWSIIETSLPRLFMQVSVLLDE
jgi:uncharacterized protein with HEPN domain